MFLGQTNRQGTKHEVGHRLNAHLSCSSSLLRNLTQMSSIEIIYLYSFLHKNCAESCFVHVIFQKYNVSCLLPICFVTWILPKIIPQKCNSTCMEVWLHATIHAVYWQVHIFCIHTHKWWVSYGKEIVHDITPPIAKGWHSVTKDPSSCNMHPVNALAKMSSSIPYQYPSKAKSFGG